MKYHHIVQLKLKVKLDIKKYEIKSYHAVKLEVSIESDRSVSAVKCEGNIGHIRPTTLLKKSPSVFSFALSFLSFVGAQWPKVKFVKNW